MATTVPGGRYRRPDGTIVNAHGEPLEAAPVAPQTVAPPKVEEPNARWNKTQLTEYAAEHGIDISAATTNAEILGAIETAQAATHDAGGDAGGGDAGESGNADAAANDGGNDAGGSTQDAQ